MGSTWRSTPFFQGGICLDGILGDPKQKNGWNTWGFLLDGILGVSKYLVFLDSYTVGILFLECLGIPLFQEWVLGFQKFLTS